MLYIFRKRIRKNLVYIITFVFQFLCVGDYLKCINETTTPIEMCAGLVESVPRPKMLEQTRYFNVNFDSNGFLFLFFLIFFDISEKYLQFRKKTFVEEGFFSPCKSNWIYVPRNYFSNYVYLKDKHINLKGIGKILFVSVLTNLLICKFLNFT